jgi:sulfite exporter TauE/SafE
MFATPFLIGLAGSLHCIGMCSPLIIAASGRKRAVVRNLAYNLGRILTYGLLGSVVSFVGMGLSFAGVQQGISILVGVIILIIAIVNYRLVIPSAINRALNKAIVMVKTKFRLNPVMLGMVNGVLPCGMTLVALGYCVTLDWPADGFLAMIYFGLGTLPVMFGASMVLKAFINKLRIGYRPVQLTLMIISAILLIGRGISDFGAAHHHSHQPTDIVVCGSDQ